MRTKDLAIVLTGTIVPNNRYARHPNPQQRRAEYLEAICYYRRFARVCFLENSSYSLASDPEFVESPDVSILKLPLSMLPEKGKGYQEFEMLDAWLETEREIPLRWIKVSGRYIYRDFERLLGDCLREPSWHMVIDQHRCSRMAKTSVFYVETAYYRANLAGLYRDCDDDTGEWVERVLYRRLASLREREVRIFSVEPDVVGTSGSTGASLEDGRLRHSVKRLLRKLNFSIDKRYIWFKR